MNDSCPLCHNQITNTIYHSNNNDKPIDCNVENQEETDFIHHTILTTIKRNKEEKIRRLVVELQSLNQDLTLSSFTDSSSSSFSSPHPSITSDLKTNSFVSASASSSFHSTSQSLKRPFNYTDLDTDVCLLQQNTIAKTTLPKIQKLQSMYQEVEQLYTDNPQEFKQNLGNLTKYTHLKCIATLNSLERSLWGSLSFLISSVEYNHEGTFFAVGGVQKSVQLYDVCGLRESQQQHLTSKQEQIKELQGNSLKSRSEYLRLNSRISISSAIRDAMGSDEDEDTNSVVDSGRYPLVKMDTRSKVSSLAWSSDNKNFISAANYEGVIQVWDVSRATCIQEYDEHVKRAWAIDYSKHTPGLMASASDDFSVKLWTKNQSQSIYTLQTKASACSVRFNPFTEHELAYGSSDHSVYTHDTRSMRHPLSTITLHSKAASYVRYISSDTLISASTDSTLKSFSTIGSVNGNVVKPIKTFSGHLNERNFVGMGLNASAKYIACGSERNEMVVYSRYCCKPWCVRGFTAGRMDSGSFVSAVCWNPVKENEVLGANSAGIVNMYEMC